MISQRREEAAKAESLSAVFAFDKSIRFVSIVGRDGEAVASAGRPGLASFEPEEMTASLFIRAAIVWGMSEGMNEFHGKVRSAIVIREKVTLVCFFVPSRIYLVLAEPEFSIAETERLGQYLDNLSIT